MIYPQSTTYALEALGYMAGLGDGATVKTRELAETLKIPEHFLGKVMSQLVKKKLIKSAKGPTGGFALAVDPSKVTLYRILAALDSLGPLEEDCVMGLARCTDEAPCAFHNSWSEFRRSVVENSQKLNLIQLAEIVKAKMRVTQL